MDENLPDAFANDPYAEYSALENRINQLRERYDIRLSMCGRLIFPFRNVPPKYLFKYTSVEILKLILSNKSVRYTQAEMLDDIFEESPSHDNLRSSIPDYEDGPTMIIDIYDDDKRLEAFDRVKAYRQELAKRGEFIDNKPMVITSNGIIPGWKYEKGNRSYKEAAERVRKPLAFSLTEVYDNKLMWALYADNFRGVCLSLETRNKYFYGNRDNIGRSGFFSDVEYRPMTIEDYKYRLPHERFFIKSPDWSYQKEWRRIEFHNSANSVDWSTQVAIFQIDPAIIDGVIFGPRCTESDVGAIRGIISRDIKLSHLVFWKMKRVLSDLILEPIE